MASQEETLAQAQRKAAELVSEDEAWRDGLEDAVASPLLDWALARTDAALARAWMQGQPETTDPSELPYAVADQARALLSVLSDLWRSHTEVEVWRAAESLLGPPLFADTEDGRAAAKQALASERHT